MIDWLWTRKMSTPVKKVPIHLQVSGAFCTCKFFAFGLLVFREGKKLFLYALRIKAKWWTSMVAINRDRSFIALICSMVKYIFRVGFAYWFFFCFSTAHLIVLDESHSQQRINRSIFYYEIFAIKIYAKSLNYMFYNFIDSWIKSSLLFFWLLCIFFLIFSCKFRVGYFQFFYSYFYFHLFFFTFISFNVIF